MSARDLIRTAFFNQQPKSIVTTFAGVAVELRQPPLGEIIAKEDQTFGRREAMVKMLCDYCFVPGTSEKIFEDSDKEMLMAMPFNGDWMKLQRDIDSLVDLDTALKEAAKNSDETN